MPAVDGTIQLSELEALATANKLEELAIYINANSALEDFNYDHRGDGYGNSYALRYAAKFGHTNLFKILLNIPKVKQAASAIQNYALRYAILNKNHTIIRDLLDLGNVRDSLSHDAMYIILYTIESNNIELFNELLQNPAVAYGFGSIPNKSLKYVLEYGNNDMLASLLRIPEIIQEIFNLNDLSLPNAEGKTTLDVASNSQPPERGLMSKTKKLTM